MTDKELLKTLTGSEDVEKTDDTHVTVAYVDDVTQVIGNKNKLEYKVYLQKAYEITEKYFQINMLAINKTKTELLHVPAPNEDLEEVIVMTSNGSIITSYGKSTYRKKYAEICQEINNELQTRKYLSPMSNISLS